jgi:fibronectin-binding autotransporter adhesin
MQARETRHQKTRRLIARQHSVALATISGQPTRSPLETPRHRRQSLRVQLAASAAAVLVCTASFPTHSAWAASATWTGPTDGNWEDTTSTNNWSTDSATTPGSYPGSTSGIANADIATFYNSSATNLDTTITLAVPLNIGGIVFPGVNSQQAYTIGTIAGGSLLLTNSGSITINASGAGETQSVNAPIVLEPATGSTTGAGSFNNDSALSGSVLSVGGSVTGGTTSSSITLNLTGSNVFANVVSGVISDGGAVGGLTISKTNSGRWKLSGANTYTGGTSIAGGTIEITQASSLGTNAVSFTGSGTLSAAATLTYSNPITVGSTFTAGIANTTAGSNTSTPVVFSSLISGLGNVTLSGASSSTVSPIELSNDSNSFSGNFSTLNGYLQFTSVANSGVNSSLGAGTTAYTLGNGTLALAFSYVGATSTSTNRALNWSGTAPLQLDASGGGTVQYLGSGNLRSGDSTQTLTLSGTNTGNNALAQVINDSPNSGVTSVMKSGAGTWVLTGANTYSGATSVSGGVLTIDTTSTATSTGTANASASIANSTSIALSSTGTLHLISSTASPVSMLSRAANVVIATTSTIDLDLNGQYQPVSTFEIGSTFQPAGFYGSSAGLGALGITPTPGSAQADDETYFTTGSLGTLDVAVPEPTSLSLLAIGAVGFLGRRRRRNPPTALLPC